MNNFEADWGKAPPGNRLLGDELRVPLEWIASEHYGRRWEVKSYRDLREYASHPAAILSDGEDAVFVKLSEVANGMDQFEVELAGLRYLARYAGVQVPVPIGNYPVEGGVLMVMEAAPEIDRTRQQWREIGHTLAQIHRIKGDSFGFEKQGYFGPLYQDNRPSCEWFSFYTERRLWPRLMQAIDSGNMPSESIWEVEKFISRLPGLDIPEVEPTLLHGDAQKNNFISTAHGTLVIDPAVYYGHPEIDLAYVDYFEPVPDDVFRAYQEELPIAPGFAERRDLWRVPAYLAAVAVEGQIHLPRLANAVRKYL